MRNKPIFGIALFILFSTFVSQNKVTINEFDIKEIKIENNEVLEDQELINIFSFLYSKNIIFLNSYDLKKNINHLFVFLITFYMNTYIFRHCFRLRKIELLFLFPSRF